MRGIRIAASVEVDKSCLCPRSHGNDDGSSNGAAPGMSLGNRFRERCALLRWLTHAQDRIDDPGRGTLDRMEFRYPEPIPGIAAYVISEVWEAPSAYSESMTSR